MTDNWGQLKLAATQQGLREARALRAGVGRFGGDETRSTQSVIDTVSKIINGSLEGQKRLDELVGTLPNPSAPPATWMGNLDSLLHDDIEESAAHTYLQHTLPWMRKVPELSQLCHQVLSSQPLRRSIISQVNRRMGRRPAVTSQQVDPRTVQTYLHKIAVQYTESVANMEVALLKPFGESSCTVLSVTLGHTLRALIVLRSLVIEAVTVRGFKEDFVSDDDTLDLWTPSRYKVFQKVQDASHIALLHFYGTVPSMADIAVKTFLTWLQSFTNLFSAACKKCGHILPRGGEMVPPTWRDLRTLDPYHECCRT